MPRNIYKQKKTKDYVNKKSKDVKFIENIKWYFILVVVYSISNFVLGLFNLISPYPSRIHFVVGLFFGLLGLVWFVLNVLMFRKFRKLNLNWKYLALPLYYLGIYLSLIALGIYVGFSILSLDESLILKYAQWSNYWLIIESILTATFAVYVLSRVRPYATSPSQPI